MKSAEIQMHKIILIISESLEIVNILKENVIKSLLKKTQFAQKFMTSCKFFRGIFRGAKNIGALIAENFYKAPIFFQKQLQYLRHCDII